MTSKMDSNARFTLGVRAKKNLGPTLSIFGLQIDPQVTNKCYNIDVRILINAGILAPRIANCLLFSLFNIFPNWPPKFDVILFPALGPIQGHKVQHLVVTWGILKSFFFYFSLDSDVKPLGLISTFALRGMLDLCETLALTRSVKRA